LEPTRLTYEDALLYLEKAVADKGAEYTYPKSTARRVTYDSGTEVFEDTQCVYFDTETHQPSCIIGHVLHYMGYTPTQISPYEGQTVATMTDNGFLIVDRATETLLATAQAHQDTRKSWGESLRLARLEVDDV
jgi:hypothetical protein